MANSIFDEINPKTFRYMAFCKPCNLATFLEHNENAICNNCKKALEIIPYFNPAKDYALDVDKYAINMMYALYKKGLHKSRVVFDEFFRKAPFVKPDPLNPTEVGGYAVFGGLETLIDIIENLYFNDTDIDYLREQPERYDERFLDYLKGMEFTGNLYAMKEGDINFANVPYARIDGPIDECLWIEAQFLNTTNYQSLTMTKGSRIMTSAVNDTVIEMGYRRAQGRDAAVYGARSAYVAGFASTSNVKAGKQFGIPTAGTMAHAFIQFFPNEKEAFTAFADAFQGNPNMKVSTLPDTYDVLKSGIPNTIELAAYMKQKGDSLFGIRLDSGDIAYLSKMSRKMMDEAGFPNTVIGASGDIDEHTISKLKSQGAQIGFWGIGTKYITGFDEPALNGVHKIVAREEMEAFEGTRMVSNRKTAKEWVHLIKISESANKTINPGFKEPVRLLDLETGKYKAYYLMLQGEDIDETKELLLVHPTDFTKSTIAKNFKVEKLLHPIFLNGKRVFKTPSLVETRNYHKQQKAKFWEEYLRIDYPEVFPVSFSDRLYNLKKRLIQEKKMK